MFIKNIIGSIEKYRFSIFKIIFYEFLFTIKGFKGNKVDFINSKDFADNIPCPYYFLVKIKKFLNKNKINSFIDLGSGSGRTIYFFKRYFDIKFYGIELFKESYISAQNLFSKDENIQIINDDFRNLNFLNLDADCFFLNEPLKNRKDFELVVKAIQTKNNNINKKFFIILINVTQQDLSHFSSLELKDSNTIGKNRNDVHGGGPRGYYIFSN